MARIQTLEQEKTELVTQVAAGKEKVGGSNSRYVCVCGDPLPYCFISHAGSILSRDCKGGRNGWLMLMHALQDCT